jgi:heterodisulfide reductase subunit D
MGIGMKLKKNKWMITLVFNTKWNDKKKLISGFKNAKQYYAVDGSHTNMKELLKCTLCPNMCRFECPVLRVTQKEMYAPATKARISFHMERGHTPMTDLHSAEVAYMCTNCNGCQNWCPMDISTGDLLRGVRADLSEKQIYIPKVKEFESRVAKNKTTFTETTFSSHSEFNVNMENPEVFYYIGCVMAEKKPEAAIANINILKKAGISFCTHTDERQCCSGPLSTLGFDNTVKQFASRNLDLFTRSGAKIIVTDCPKCATTIADTYKQLGLKHDFQVFTTTQYYRQLIEHGRLKPIKSVNKSITYHDPCILARNIERVEHVDTGDLNLETRYQKEVVLDSARYIISKIPGLVFKEPFLHGQQTQCCGRGGVMHVHHDEISDKIGKQRLSELEKTGAENIVTACPSCEEGFMFNSDKKEIMDISEILALSLE